MEILKGDLIHLALAGHFDVIIHGCNCFCTMGAGIAKQIQTLFPKSYQADLQTGKGDKNKLGTYSSVEIENSDNNFTIVNAYIQYDFSGYGVLVDYKAVKNVFFKISSDFAGKSIGYPKIGAGLAKGDWNKISEIINIELKNQDHTLVELN